MPIRHVKTWILFANQQTKFDFWLIIFSGPWSTSEIGLGIPLKSKDETLIDSLCKEKCKE